MAATSISERNQDATIYVGGLDEKVTEALLWELFVQAGPVVRVHMPKDRLNQQHQGYGFVEFMGAEDADYAVKIMNMIKVYGRLIKVNKSVENQKNLDVGANIFIGNLDPEVDEKLLYDTFSAFGVVLQTPKIMRELETGNSKGFAFVNFASFEASDTAIEAMNGQYLCNRAISISYAFKKDSKGERHGSAAERLLAAQNPKSQADRPHQLFADAPAPPPENLPPPPPPLRMSLPPPPLPKAPPPTPFGMLPPPPPPSSRNYPGVFMQMQNGMQHPMYNNNMGMPNQMPPLPSNQLPPLPPNQMPPLPPNQMPPLPPYQLPPLPPNQMPPLPQMTFLPPPPPPQHQPQ